MSSSFQEWKTKAFDNYKATESWINERISIKDDFINMLEDVIVYDEIVFSNDFHSIVLKWKSDFQFQLSKNDLEKLQCDYCIRIIYSEGFLPVCLELYPFGQPVGEVE